MICSLSSTSVRRLPRWTEIKHLPGVERGALEPWTLVLLASILAALWTLSQYLNTLCSGVWLALEAWRSLESTSESSRVLGLNSRRTFYWKIISIAQQPEEIDHCNKSRSALETRNFCSRSSVTSACSNYCHSPSDFGAMLFSSNRAYGDASTLYERGKDWNKNQVDGSSSLLDAANLANVTLRSSSAISRPTWDATLVVISRLVCFFDVPQ